MADKSSSWLMVDQQSRSKLYESLVHLAKTAPKGEAIAAAQAVIVLRREELKGRAKELDRQPQSDKAVRTAFEIIGIRKRMEREGGQ